MKNVILTLFALFVIVFSLTGRSVVAALALGWLIFSLCALLQRHPPREILRVSLQGIYKVHTILILFALVGLLTAVWRSSATVATIIFYCSSLFSPKLMLLLCFWLNCLISLLMGTSFGSAATMGVITMGIARAVGVDPLLAGGAILSGIYFGDRCSPVSTSALLVAQLTETDLYRNIRAMFKTCIVPFAVSSLLYLGLGWFTAGEGAMDSGVYDQFAAHYVLSWVNLLPAVLILVLAVLRVKVKGVLLCSILCGLMVSLFVQKMPPLELLSALITGYHAPTVELAALFDGGGLTSMLRVTLIVMISSTYAGLFALTGLLEDVDHGMRELTRRTGFFTGTLAAALLTGLMACNQTLTILLTHQLCGGLTADREEAALALEDTAVVLSPLVPWSIAGAVPIAAVGTTAACIPFAFYLYLLPLCRLADEVLKKRK